MKNKNTIIGIVVAVIVAAVVACIFIFSNNNNNNTTTNSNGNQENGNSNVSENKDVDAIDNDDNYYVSINGKKFKAGDKISSLKEIGLKQQDRVLSEKVKKNTYVIGAGTIENAAGNRVINLTPYNPTDDTITVADAVIGSCDVGEYSYSKISKDVLDLNIEVGGIKLGDSLEDVEKVFGKTDSVYTSESLGYKKYTYKSKKIYRSYEITIDKDGKVSQIYWKNLEFNK